MMKMKAEADVQAAVVAALSDAPGIVGIVSGIFDDPPPHATYPYITIADGVVTDCNTKTARGRELRIAITIWDDGEIHARLHALVTAVETAMATLPRDLPGWRIASLVFLRSLVVRDSAGSWAELVEYRIRILEREG
jgi:Protein of unknown function (DUF3168)